MLLLIVHRLLCSVHHRIVNYYYLSFLRNRSKTKSKSGLYHHPAHHLPHRRYSTGAVINTYCYPQQISLKLFAPSTTSYAAPPLLNGY